MINSVGINYFIDLPKEIKIHTFSYLDDLSLDNASFVCKEWNNIIKDNFHLDISNSKTEQKIEKLRTIHLRLETLPLIMKETSPIDCLQKLAAQNPNLKSITFSKEERLDPSTLLSIPQLIPNIKVLKGIAAKNLMAEGFTTFNGYIRNSHAGLSVDDIWRRIAIHMPDLKKVDIIAPFEKTTVAQVFQSCPKIESFTLYLLGDDLIEDIEAVFHVHGKKITSLTFGDCPFSHSHLPVNAENMQKILSLFPNLKKLTIERKFTGFNFPTVELEELHIKKGDHFGKTGFEKIKAAFPNLKKINLRSLGMKCEELIENINLLPKTLTHFSNISQNIKEEEYDALVEKLKKEFPCLENIQLGRSDGKRHYFNLKKMDSPS